MGNNGTPIAKPAGVLRRIRALPIHLPLASAHAASTPTTTDVASSTAIAAVIDQALAEGPTTKSQLIYTARQSTTDPAVTRSLKRLPDITYTSSRHIWQHLHP